jgi:MSHA pilin protein MshC
MGQRAGGFTLVELVTIMVLLGILAAVAIPRMDTGGYRALEFHEQTVAALRFAQKTAVSHRRPVCVTFPDIHTLVLTIDGDRDGVCETALALPGTTINQLLSGDRAAAFFAPLPAALTFVADGTSAGAAFAAGNEPITVVGATGYVR